MDARLGSGLLCQRAQGRGVGRRHIREAGAEALVVLPGQGRHGEKQDVVRDQHDLAGLVIQVDGSGCVRNDHRPHAQQLHHAHGIGSILRGVALVEVHPPLHHGDLLPGEDAAFDRPAWLGEEVTGDPKYYNSMLMKNPYKNWK